MAEKKVKDTKKTTAKKADTKEKPKKTTKTTKSKTKTGKAKTTKTTKSKSKKREAESFDDMSIVIVDDDITVDQEKINEERRAYLEEARSQEAVD